MVCSRRRLTSGGGSPWYLGYKADGIDPSIILQFDSQRYAANNEAKSFSDILTFSRASTATYFDANGVMQTSAADVQRFDYDPLTGEKLGILIEGQRTNLVRYSNGSGGTTTVSYGGITATKVRQETRNGVSGTVITISGTASLTGGFALSLTTSGDIPTTTGHTFTISAYTEVIEDRGANRPVVNLGIRSLNGSTQVDFDRVFLNLQTISGFARSSGTATTDQATMNGIQSVVEVSFSSGHTYDFDIWVGGVQTEEAGFASSLIPTSGSAATRPADIVKNASSNTVKFADWYNQSEGTFLLYWHVDHLFTESGRLLYAAYASADQWESRIYAEGSGTGPILRHKINSGSVTQSQLGASALIGNSFKEAHAYKANDFGWNRGGTSSEYDTSGTPPTVNTFTLGGINTTNQIFGHVKEFRYYPIRVTNSELQRITNA